MTDWHLMQNALDPEGFHRAAQGNADERLEKLKEIQAAYNHHMKETQ